MDYVNFLIALAEDADTKMRRKLNKFKSRDEIKSSVRWQKMSHPSAPNMDNSLGHADVRKGFGYTR